MFSCKFSQVFTEQLWMTAVEFFILNSADLWYVPCSKLLRDVENHKFSETDQKMSVKHTLGFYERKNATFVDFVWRNYTSISSICASRSFRSLKTS